MNLISSHAAFGRDWLHKPSTCEGGSYFVWWMQKRSCVREPSQQSLCRGLQLESAEGHCLMQVETGSDNGFLAELRRMKLAKEELSLSDCWVWRGIYIGVAFNDYGFSGTRKPMERPISRAGSSVGHGVVASISTVVHDVQDSLNTTAATPECGLMIFWKHFKVLGQC